MVGYLVIVGYVRAAWYGRLWEGSLSWQGSLASLGLLLILTDAPRVDLEPVERLPHPQNVAGLRLRPEVVGAEGPVVHLWEEGGTDEKREGEKIVFLFSITFFKGRGRGEEKYLSLLFCHSVILCTLYTFGKSNFFWHNKEEMG